MTSVSINSIFDDMSFIAYEHIINRKDVGAGALIHIVYIEI